MKKFVQKVQNIAFFRRALRKFWLIHSKNAENRMSFEIHFATITTGSLNFGMSFFGQLSLSFFIENVKISML